MLLTQEIKQNVRWPALIKRKRKALKESKVEFGRRFGVSGQAVGYWEDGSNQAPYAVTWWLYKELLDKHERKLKRQMGNQ